MTTKDLDPQTDDFQEQASLRIDVDHYKQIREIRIREGHVLAGPSYLDPKERVHEDFDLEFDKVAQTAVYKNLPLPPNRLSVQDVLAILFKAKNAHTTNDIYASLHEILRNQRFIGKQGYQPDQKKLNGILADYYTTKTDQSDEGGEAEVDCTLALSRDVPFNWVMVNIEDHQEKPLFSATMNRESISGRNAQRQFPPPDEGPPPPILPEDVPEFAHLTLPKTQGAWARYDAELLVPVPGFPDPVPVALNRVEIKVLKREDVPLQGVDVPHRWIEVETQIGEDIDARKVVETARLLVDENAYRDSHRFHIARGYVRRQFRDSQNKSEEYVAKFDPEEDRLAKFYPEKLPGNRFPIRNVLPLLFGAKILSQKMSLDVRSRISHALMDDNLKRYFDRADPFSIDGKPAINCIEVKPVSAVPVIRPGSKQSQLPDSLNYVIKVSNDCPWGWLFIDLSLHAEDSPKILFAGKLTLRDFGEKETTRFLESEDDLRKTDPEEKAAQTMFRLARQLENYRKYAEARARYKKIGNDYPDTLAARNAETALKRLSP